MELRVMGIDFPHAAGEFCRKAEYEEYVFCYFLTPFVYLCEGKMLQGEAGDILINSPGQTVYHGPRVNMTEGFRNDWMHIKGKDLEELLSRYPLPIGKAFRAPEPYFWREYMGRLLAEFHIRGEGSEDMIKSIVTEMVINTHRAYAGEQVEKTDSAIAAVRREMLRTLSKKWTLSEMADRSGYAVSRFCELYREMFGIAPISDLSRERIRLAKRLLRSGQATVTQVADECGFGSIGHFSKTFKREVGKTPTEYMQRK